MGWLQNVNGSYYPFGLTMAGISSKASGALANKYKFNGGNELQSGEFSDGSGLEMYDAKNRLYDPQAPHFWQQDPLANINFGQSPYNFCDNNPIRFNDPWGLSKQGFGFEDDTKPDEGLQGVTVTPHGNKQTDNTLGYYQAAGMADKAMARGINIDNVDLRRFGYDDRQRLHYMFSDERKKHDVIYNDRTLENTFYAVLASPILIAEYPLLFFSKSTLIVKGSLMVGDASLQYLEKHSVNPIQTISSIGGPLTYGLGGATTFDWRTFTPGIDDKASVTTVAVSTFFNWAGGKAVDGWLTGGGSPWATGAVSNISSIWGDGINAQITGASDQFMNPDK